MGARELPHRVGADLVDDTLQRVGVGSHGFDLGIVLCAAEVSAGVRDPANVAALGILHVAVKVACPTTQNQSNFPDEALRCAFASYAVAIRSIVSSAREVAPAGSPF